MDETEDDVDISALFGQCLKSIRNQQNLTQTQLSEKLGISQKHLSVIENGKQFPSAHLISKITKTLRIKPYELFGGIDHKSNDAENLRKEITKSVTANAMMIQNIVNSKFAVLLSQIEELKNDR